MKNGHQTQAQYRPDQDDLNDWDESLNKADEEKKPSELKKDQSSGRKKSVASRLWVIILSVVVLILFYALAQNWKKQASLRNITITGNHVVKRDALINQLKPLIGNRLHNISLADIETRLLKNGYIKQVIATKEFPDGIRLQINERKPVAVTILNQKVYVIDHEGMVLDYRPETVSKRRLPVISGVAKIKTLENGFKQIQQNQFQAAVSLIEELDRSRLAGNLIGEINIAEPNRLYARTSEGKTKLIFGDEGRYEELIEKFEAFWVKEVVKKGLKRFAYIDLRFKDKVFVKEI